MIQGQGTGTQSKEYGLDRILAQQLSIIGNIKTGPKNKNNPRVRDAKVIYVDMNAGSGYNSIAGCVGSPIIFLQAALLHEYIKDIYFIEKNRTNISELVSHLEQLTRSDWGGCSCSEILPGLMFLDPEENGGAREWYGYTPDEKNNILVTHGDNKEALPRIMSSLKGQSPFGLIYNDPNGRPDFEVLQQISRLPQTYCVDIMIHVSGTLYNFPRIVHGKSNPEKWLKISEHIARINKKEWIVREFQPGDCQHWTFLIGTNWTDYRAWEKKGFYKIRLDKGKAIFDILDNTEEERRVRGQK